MKKTKLLTGAALLSMTAGIALPLVTSCNKVSTGNIKFKLTDGVTASASEFKVGDKVVINYTVKNTNLVVTSSCITVKFDGWKVKPSRTTYRVDTTNQKITIFAAPTTDITVKINANEAKTIEKVSLSIETSDDWQIVDGCGNNVDSWDKEFAAPTYDESGQLETFTYFYEALGNISVVSTRTDKTYQWNGFADTQGTPLSDWETPILSNTVLVPTFKEIETPEEPSRILNLKVADYDIPEMNEVKYKLGRLRVDNTDAFSTELLYTFDVSGTWADLYNAIKDYIWPLSDAFVFQGFVDMRSGEIIDVESQQAAQETIGGYLSTVEDQNIYLSFGLKSDDVNILKLEWNASSNSFVANFEGYVPDNPWVDVVVDTREIPSSSSNDKQRIFLYETVGESSNMLPINFFCNDYQFEEQEPTINLYSSLGINVKLGYDTYPDMTGAYGYPYKRYYLTSFDSNEEEHPFITWSDIQTLGIIDFKVCLNQEYYDNVQIHFGAWPQQ